MKSKIMFLLTSRKFWAAVIAIVMSVISQLDPKFPVSEDTMLQATLVIVAYILGTAIEDAGRARLTAAALDAETKKAK